MMQDAKIGLYDLVKATTLASHKSPASMLHTPPSTLLALRP
jgi:hypothetical protein